MLHVNAPQTSDGPRNGLFVLSAVKVSQQRVVD